MGDLSQNFNRSEFACACCGRADVDDLLVEALQLLRSLVGLPIHVNSGVRCPKHNASKAVKGATDSQHLLGRAADIVIQGLDPWEMFENAMVITAFRYGGVGVYPENGFIHVDVRGFRARWIRIGKVYAKFDDIKV